MSPKESAHVALRIAGAVRKTAWSRVEKKCHAITALQAGN